MYENYPYDNTTFFKDSSRSLNIVTENEKNAQSIVSFLDTAYWVARREHHRNPEVKYNTSTSGNSVKITSVRNNLEDIVAAINDMYSLSYIAKTTRDKLVLEVDKSEDTPERRAKIKAEFIENIKARQKLRQQQAPVGKGSQLLMPPKKNLPQASHTTNSHHQNGDVNVTTSKPPFK